MPDYISPVVGYRVWQWDASGLKCCAGNTGVRVLLWNRTALSTGRKHILWDKLNMRWEASGSGVDFIHAFHSPDDRVFVLTGGGVSAESDIPSFRDVGGLGRDLCWH